MIDRGQVADIYLHTFAGRTDAYSPWTGEHWTAVREQLTPAIVLAAFDGHAPLAGYFTGTDSWTHVAAVDFDTENGWDQAIALGRALWGAGAPCYLERSRRGAHLWLVLAERLPAVAIRRALRAALQLAGIAEDPKIELRPGQDRITPEQLGNALRLPTMPHQTTGKRYRLISPVSGESIGASLSEILLALELAPASAITSLAERYQPIVDPRSIPSSYRRPKAHDEDGPNVVEILAGLGIPAVPGRAVRCPFHEDHHPSLSIARDERRVFCKSPTCDANNTGRGLGSNQLAALIARRAG